MPRLQGRNNRHNIRRDNSVNPREYNKMPYFYGQEPLPSSTPFDISAIMQRRAGFSRLEMLLLGTVVAAAVLVPVVYSLSPEQSQDYNTNKPDYQHEKNYGGHDKHSTIVQQEVYLDSSGVNVSATLPVTRETLFDGSIPQSPELAQFYSELHKLGVDKHDFKQIVRAGGNFSDLPALGRVIKAGARTDQVVDLYQNGALRNENFIAATELLPDKSDETNNINPFSLYLLEELVKAGFVKEDLTSVRLFAAKKTSPYTIVDWYKTGLIRNPDFVLLADGLQSYIQDYNYLDDIIKQGFVKDDIPLIQKLVKNGNEDYTILNLYRENLIHNQDFVQIYDALSALGINSSYWAKDLVNVGAVSNDIPLIVKAVSVKLSEASSITSRLVEAYKNGRMKDESFLALVDVLSGYGCDLYSIERFVDAGGNSGHLPQLQEMHEQGIDGQHMLWDFHEKFDKDYVDNAKPLTDMGFSARQILNLRDEGIRATDENIAIAAKYAASSIDKDLAIKLMINHIEPSDENIRFFESYESQRRFYPTKDIINLGIRRIQPEPELFTKRYEINYSRTTASNGLGTTFVLAGSVDDSYASYRLAIAGISAEYANTMVAKGFRDSAQIVLLHHAGITPEQVDALREEHGETPTFPALINNAKLSRPIGVDESNERQRRQLRMFSPRVSFEKLYDDDDGDGEGEITLGIYCQFPNDISRVNSKLLEILGSDRDIKNVLAWLEPIAASRRIKLKYLETKQDFIDPMRNYDIKFFAGHAGCGRGPDFSREAGEHDYLRMGRDILTIPEYYLHDDDEVIEYLHNGLVRIRGGSQDLDGLQVGCDVFIYEGCRTELYYRAILAERFPQLDFVGTNYATSYMPSDLITALVIGLAREMPLDEALRTTEALLRQDLLDAIKSEMEMYKNIMPIEKYPTKVFGQ